LEGVGHSPICGVRALLLSLQCADTDICSTVTTCDYHTGQCHAPVMMLYQLHWVKWQRERAGELKTMLKEAVIVSFTLILHIWYRN
jgi:hypothetical protein